MEERNMKKMSRILGLVLALCAVVSLFTVSASAATLPDPAATLSKVTDMAEDAAKLGDSVSRIATAPICHRGDALNELDRTAQNAKDLAGRVTDAGDVVADTVSAPLRQANEVGNELIRTLDNVNALVNLAK